MIFYLAFLLLAVSSLTFEAANSAVQYPDKEALYEQVFAKEGGQSLDPIEFKKLLEDLNVSYYGLNDGASHSLRNTVSSLIGACDTSNSAKCYQGVFLQLNSLLRANAQFTVNLVPYLQHCKSEMFTKCKQYFDGELHENVKHLDVIYKDELESLVGMITRASKESSQELTSFSVKIPGPIVKKVVKEFLETHNNLVDVNQFKDLDESGKCKRALDTVCNVAIDQIGRSTQHYEQHFLPDREFYPKLKRFELKWILNVKICRFIQQNINALCEYPDATATTASDRLD